MLNSLKTFVVFAGLILLLIGVSGFFYLQSWSTSEGPLKSAAEFDLQRGQSLRSFSDELYQKNIISNKRLFHFVAKKHFSKFKAGHYKAEPQTSPQEIISMIQNGKTFHKVLLQITIPEGFTLKKIAKRLEAKGIGSYREIMALAFNRRYLEQKNLGFAKSLEGFLYPLTYHFFKKPSVKEVFDTMIKEFWKNLPDNYQDRIREKKLSLYEAVTFASLIELETKLDEERPMVAEVIWNRLNKNIALGIDAAIIYGIKDYKGDIRTKHLKDKKNPYNTRLHRGLPPTPIGSPSKSSLLAILNPSSFGYYYYVLKKPGSDHHYFSKTLAEHNREVKKFLKRH